MEEGSQKAEDRNQKKFALALVTGATSGVGEALCRLLASKGVHLLITGRNSCKLEQLKEEFSKQVQIFSIVADLANPLQRQKLIEIIWEYSPDLVINNAGLGHYGEALSHPTSAELEILNVNGTAVLEITLEAARMMRSRKIKGTILNVSSATAFQPMPFHAVYAASKAFVNRFSEALDWELQSDGIRVLTSCPGMIKTAFSKRAGGIYQPVDDKLSMSADFAAEEIWWQINTGKTLHIFNWKYRLGIYLSYLIPSKWRAKILQKRISSRLVIGKTQ